MRDRLGIKDFVVSMEWVFYFSMIMQPESRIELQAINNVACAGNVMPVIHQSITVISPVCLCGRSSLYPSMPFITVSRSTDPHRLLIGRRHDQPPSRYQLHVPARLRLPHSTPQWSSVCHPKSQTQKSSPRQITVPLPSPLFLGFASLSSSERSNRK